MIITASLGCKFSQPDDAPDVIGSGESEDETGEEYSRCSPFKLSGLPEIEIRKPQFDKEKYGENEVYGGEDYVVHNRFYLLGCSRPRALDRTGNIPAGVGGDGQQRDEHCRHDEY